MHQNLFHNLNQIAFLSLILLVVHLCSTNGEITTVTVSSDSRPTILFTDFCFRSNGSVTLTLSNVSVTTTSTTPTNGSRLTFYLIDADRLIYYMVVYPFEDGKTCIAESSSLLPTAFDHPIARFDELSPESSLKKTLRATSLNNYGIYFANCEPNTSVSMHVVIETYNLNKDGSKDYLGVGESRKPKVFFVFTLLYVPLIALWLYGCYENKAFIHRIHLVMTVLLFAKALNLLCAVEDKHYIQITGTPHGWDMMFYIFYFIRGILFLTVIMLIGSGWSFLEPFLKGKEKAVLAIGILLQISTNIAYIFIDESGPYNRKYLFLKVAFFLLDVVGFGVVVVPVVRSIRSLKNGAKADGTAATTLVKLIRFRNFFGWIMVYWYMTRSMKYASSYFCFTSWLIEATVEAFTILFYIVMFYLFRPREQNEYLNLEEDEQDEETALRIIRTEFERI